MTDSSNQNCSEEETQIEILDVTKMEDIAQPIKKTKSKGVILERRVSPRLRDIPEDKRPYYGSDRRKRLEDPKNDVCDSKIGDSNRKRQFDSCKSDTSKKRAKIDHSMQEQLPDVPREEVEDSSIKGDVAVGSTPTQYNDTEIFELEDSDYLKWTNYESFIEEVICGKAGAMLKQTLQTYNNHYLHFVQEEEKICKKAEANDLHSANGTSDRGNSIIGAKLSAKRPDLKAVTEMMNKKEIVYPEKRFGHLPGIVVGHQFFSRAEMVAVGFHGYWLNGIDYIGKFCGKLKLRNGHTYPMAVAIVLSGQYENDVHDLNEVVYTGQGGNDLFGNKYQIKDQVLLCGNLALKNNMEQRIPVRVIRGHKDANSYSGKVYMYCGLYKVVNYWDEKGRSGFTVYKYRLKRLLGQPRVETDQVCFQEQRVREVSCSLPGLVCEDISCGEEAVPIPVINMIDHARIVPAGFIYTNSVQVGKNVTIPPTASGCNCKGNCTNPRSCSCARLNGFSFPYVRKDGGRLIRAKNIVFECGPECGCGPSCINRVSQQGLKYRLEVYRTENKGWAVRSRDFIPSGAPLCEYTGVLRRNHDLDNVSDNDYIFDMDFWHTMNGQGRRERRCVSVSNLASKVDDEMAEMESDFCIDAGTCGNISRFINHSCDPNLFVQCILSSHRDIRLARIVLFASDNIPAMQELTYDYNYELNSVHGPDGEIKQLPCHCGTNECRGRLY